MEQRLKIDWVHIIVQRVVAGLKNTLQLVADRVTFIEKRRQGLLVRMGTRELFIIVIVRTARPDKFI